MRAVKRPTSALRSDVLIMRINSPRYGTLCAHVLCRGRVRIGRRFVIDLVDSTKIYHEACYIRAPSA